MIIAQITDTHLRASGADDPTGAARERNLRRCVEDIMARSPKPQVVIHTGDMTDRGKAAEFARAHQILTHLDVPLYVVPGNRDEREGLRRTFAHHGYLRADIGFVNYTVEEHAVRLVALDSTDGESPMGRVCEQRLAWLDGALGQAPDAPTVLAMHHPPFEVAADHPFAFEDRANADALAAVVRGHPQVIRVLCGHVHRPSEVRWGGTTGSTMPCVAGDLRKGPSVEGPDGRPVDDDPLYALHTVRPDGYLQSRLEILRSRAKARLDRPV